MAGWAVQSSTWEVKHVRPTQHPTSDFSPAWQTVQNPPAHVKVFEELQEGQLPSISRDHVLLHDSSASSTILDAEVQFKNKKITQLVAKAGHWDQLTSAVPGLTPGMVVVSDLLYKTDRFLTLELNELLEQQQLQQARHVSDVVYRLADGHRSQLEIQRTREVLVAFMTSKGGTDAALSQWSVMMRWLTRREAFAHPLVGRFHIGREELDAAKAAFESAAEFDTVRDGLRVLCHAAEEIVQASQAP